MAPTSISRSLIYAIQLLIANMHVTLTCLRRTIQRRRRRRRIIMRRLQENNSYLLRLQQDRLQENLLYVPLMKKQRPRRWWCFPRSRDWWENDVLALWGDEQWLENFRMTRATLFQIADHLRPFLERRNTNMREAIPMVKRVAICIWRLANPGGYRVVAQQFGIGRTTAAMIVVEVCLAMEHALLRKTVCLGNVPEIMSGFSKLGFFHCVAATDGCHIEIACPPRQGADYINRKRFFSMLLQGTVDHRGRFMDVEIGWSGRNHDAHVFRNSALFEAMEAGVFIPGNPTITVNDVQIPPLVVADSAYPIRKWLMKPYGGALDQQKQHFNHCLSRARNVVECAFGRLKARWRCLSSRIELAEKNIISVISACFILHNICESQGHDVVFDLPEARHIELATLGAPLPMAHEEIQERAAGEKVRDALRGMLWSLHGQNP